MIVTPVLICLMLGNAETLIAGSTPGVKTWTTRMRNDPKKTLRQGQPVPVIWRTYIKNGSDQEIAEVTLRFVATDARGAKLWSMVKTASYFQDRYMPHQGSILPKTLTKEVDTPLILPWNVYARSPFVRTEIVSLKTYSNPNLRNPGHLMSFLYRSSLDQVKAAFTRDKSLLQVSENGITPALYACRGRDPRIPIYLASIGGNLKAKAKGGLTGMHFAALSLEPAMVGELAKNGLSVGAKLEDGQTPMHLAADCNNALAIAALAKNKADIDARDKIGDRAIVKACQGGWDSAFLALKKLGASFASDSQSGQGPMQGAAVCGAAMLEIVYKNGGKIQSADLPFKISPLHAAVRFGRWESIVWLLQHGADPNAKTTRGNTCYDVALSAGGEGMRKVFEEHVKMYRKAPAKGR